MRRKINTSESNPPARSKRASRAANQDALASGIKTAAQLKRENEVFASFASSARIDLRASRRLA